MAIKRFRNTSEYRNSPGRFCDDQHICDGFGFWIRRRESELHENVNPAGPGGRDGRTGAVPQTQSGLSVSEQPARRAWFPKGESGRTWMGRKSLESRPSAGFWLPGPQALQQAVHLHQRWRGCPSGMTGLVARATGKPTRPLSIRLQNRGRTIWSSLPRSQRIPAAASRRRAQRASFFPRGLAGP